MIYMKRKIFISYRRDTSFELAKSICKELEKKRNTCFFDVKSIKAGDFYQIILSKMDECDIFLLLVSDTTFDRCNDPADYVRLEIEAALERNLSIIPVMIENAVLPDKLPPSIEPIRKAHQIRYIRQYSDELYPKLFDAINAVRGNTEGHDNRTRHILTGLILAVAVVAVIFLLGGPLRPGKKQVQEPAVSAESETVTSSENNAAETNAPTDSSMAETETMQTGLSDSGSAQDEQILPDDFLLHMEELAQEKIQTITTDTGYITLHTMTGSFDIDSHYVSISNETLSKQAVFTETGGTTNFYLCYKADLTIDESWPGFQGPNDIESSYQDIAVVFKLDTFPNKFRDKDGNLSYSDQDFQFYMVYESYEDFEISLHQDLQYVDHDYYKIDLP